MDQAYVVRHKVLVEGIPARRVAEQLGISRNTVRRYVEGAEPGTRKGAACPSPVAERVRPRLVELLTESPRWTGGKQRLTATRLHELLRAEGFAVGVTVVKALAAEWKRQRREVFVPLIYPPGDLPAHAFHAAATRLVRATRRAVVQVEGGIYSVPDRWAGLDVTAHVGAFDVELHGRDGRVTHRRVRFGHVSSRWLRTNVLHRWPRRRARPDGRYLETVRGDTR